MKKILGILMILTNVLNIFMMILMSDLIDPALDDIYSVIEKQLNIVWILLIINIIATLIYFQIITKKK